MDCRTYQCTVKETQQAEDVQEAAKVRLSWNEIRIRAAAFADKWKDAGYEKGETQTFYNEFFEVFGRTRQSVGRYEQHVKKLDNSSGYIDLYWPGTLIVEQKSAGRDLEKAYGQAGDYFDSLPDDDQPEYILVSDFQTFELHNLAGRQQISFRLPELPEHVNSFAFIRGDQKRVFRDQDPANIKAAQLVGKLHDALDKSGYRGHHLEQFLVRVVFCLFADDTGIFDTQDMFLYFVENRTREDGSDVGAKLMELFQVLNTPENERQTTRDEDIARFPYINGDLFKEQLHIPAFDSAMRNYLLDACNFNWSNISPAIFGALFQSVMDPVERRAAGAYYTTEKNILKVIEPMFMDDLRAELNRLKGRKDSRRAMELKRFQERLAKLRLFDPACGCGNFLIIAYRELRELEMDVIKEIRQSGQLDGLTQELSLIDVDQFYGIEIIKFPALIAETALWMMDHIMNNRLSLEFGEVYARIPLERSPHIVHGDALETDWNDVLPARECSYVLGNPPYGGAKIQTNEQREQVRQIAILGKSGGTLDYVAAWFIKAGEYVKNSCACIGFVATNSITQGEQVAQLWPILFKRYELEIAFAHRTFAWGSDVRGTAKVHVVIIGLDKREYARKERKIFNYPDIKGEPEETIHAVISPYLFDGSKLANPHMIVQDSTVPLSVRSKMMFGNMPNDGGYLILSSEEATEIKSRHASIGDFIRPLIGAKDFMSNYHRYCLWLIDAPMPILKLGDVKEKIARVREYRENSTRVATRKLADFSALFGEIRQKHSNFILIPRHGSDKREYLPLGFFENMEIVHDSCLFISGGSLSDIAILSSKMHMIWLKYVGGKIKSDYRYAVKTVYNTFPLPLKDANLSELEPLARAILDARGEHPDASLADLYDPVLMPPNLRKAHQALDRAVDRLYRKSGFNSERERIEHLFMLYEKMQ